MTFVRSTPHAVAVALLPLNVNEDSLRPADAADRTSCKGAGSLDKSARNGRLPGAAAVRSAHNKQHHRLWPGAGADLLLQVDEFSESAQAGTPKVGVPGREGSYVRRKMGNPISLPMGFRQS